MIPRMERRRPKPPPDGYTVDDLFTLPDLPPHTELIDGSLVFATPQNNFHCTAVDLCATETTAGPSSTSTSSTR